jgi:hypothetical protein
VRSTILAVPNGFFSRANVDVIIGLYFVIPQLYLPILLAASNFPSLAMFPRPRGQAVCLSHCGHARGAVHDPQSTT